MNILNDDEKNLLEKDKNESTNPHNKTIFKNVKKNNNNLDTEFIQNDFSNFVETEGLNIKADIQLLQEMGYDKKMINKVYILLQPPNIERAIDYMSEINGIFQHDFVENHNPGNSKELCFICEKPRNSHLDYIPSELLFGNYFQNNNNNIQNNRINNRVNNILNENNFDSMSDEEDDDSFDLDRYFEDDKKKEKEENNEIKKNIVLNSVCSVCFENIIEEERNQNSLPCGHLCCKSCWTNYFKTLINDAKVEEIKCVEHDCKQIIPENFIFKYIKNDKKLISKYNKFKIRAEIIKDPNKKQCPKPDCQNYLEKSKNTNYVKCKKGHEYCFECLRPPHGKSSCEQIMEKDFLKWKKNRVVKKCPRCKIFTEKNEGCNHMTCASCKYQWCWLCLGKYSYGHYDRGECKGHQFTKADNLKEAKKGKRAKYHYYREQNQHLCCFTLFTILPCFYHGFDHPFELFDLCERYIAIFVMWFFGYFLFAGVSMANFSHDRIGLGSGRSSLEIAYYIIGVFMALCLYICFQILFFCIITPFILVSLIYPYFIDNILLFLDMNV